MSKHQALKDAIEEFQPGGADAPFSYSTVELNEKGFKALLGRKLNSRPISSVSVVAWVFVFILAASGAVSTIMIGSVAAPSFFSFLPIFIVILVYRTTLISATDDGLDFYFIESKRGSKFVVYDKFSLSYEGITNVKVKTGRFNTGFTFEFLNEGKNYKIRGYMPNKDRKMSEQAENLKHLLEKVSSKTNR